MAFTLLFWNAFNDPGVLVVFGTLDFLLLYLMVAFAVFWGVEVGGEKLPIAFLQEPRSSIDLCNGVFGAI